MTKYCFRFAPTPRTVLSPCAHLSSSPVLPSPSLLISRFIWRADNLVILRPGNVNRSIFNTGFLQLAIESPEMVSGFSQEIFKYYLYIFIFNNFKIFLQIFDIQFLNQGSGFFGLIFWLETKLVVFLRL